MAVRREIITWNDVEKLVDHLVPQFEVEFDAAIVITRGGIIPGGLLAEALNLSTILTAAVDFPAQMNEIAGQNKSGRLIAWPKFIQFPDDDLLRNKRILIIDDVWGSGRTITSVKNRVSGAMGIPYTCVLHFNPYRNLFGTVRPDYYSAVTDAYIVYPWEINRGPDAIILGNFISP